MDIDGDDEGDEGEEAKEDDCGADVTVVGGSDGVVSEGSASEVVGVDTVDNGDDDSWGGVWEGVGDVSGNDKGSLEDMLCTTLKGNVHFFATMTSAFNFLGPY